MLKDIPVALLNKSSQSFGVWDHTSMSEIFLPTDASEHPTVIPARGAGTWFTYPGGMEG